MIIARFSLLMNSSAPNALIRQKSYRPCNLHLIDGELTIQFADENEGRNIDFLDYDSKLVTYKHAIVALLSNNVCDAANVETIVKLREELRDVNEKIDTFKSALHDIMGE